MRTQDMDRPREVKKTNRAATDRQTYLQSVRVLFTARDKRREIRRAAELAKRKQLHRELNTLARISLYQ